MIDFPAIANECARHTAQPIMQAIVRTESSFNPFAIGVVGGRLERQPRNKEEAVATALALKAKGFNYSMGWSQVNQANLGRYGLTHETVFDPCQNLKTGASIFEECRVRAIKQFGDSDSATRAALSCYYSGNFTRGQQREGNSPSYADKVINNLPAAAKQDSSLAIPVISTKPEKTKSRADGKVTKAAFSETDSSPKTEEKKPSESWDVFGDF